MINICSKKPKIYKTKKYHWREKSAFQLYLETPMPPVPATKDTIRKRTNKEIKGISQHYKATSLDIRKMFNKSILQSQICTGYVSGKMALKQDFVSLKTRSYANSFLRL